MNQHFDVAVVGAGPAGSSAARIIAESGIRCMVLDRRSRIGVPVQCGELIPTVREISDLFPHSKTMLQVADVPKDIVVNSTRKIRLVSPRGHSFEFPFEANIIDRDRFDQHLADKAEDAGAEFQLNSVVEDRSKKNILKVRGKENVTCAIVIGADGPKSVIAQSIGNSYSVPNRDLSTSLQYQMNGISVDPSIVEMHFGEQIAPGGYAWIIPKGDGVANVGIGMRRNHANPNTHLREYLDYFVRKNPFVTPRLKGACIQRIVGAIIPMGGPVARTWTNNVLLTGDSAGHVMASNGGGIPTALCGGKIAGQVVVDYFKKESPLSVYEKRWMNEFGSELDTALRILRVADTVMPSDTVTDICMRLAGVRFLEPLIRCRLPSLIDLASKTIVKLMTLFL